MSEKDGGLAFPIGEFAATGYHLQNSKGAPGMSLRDYFAAQALNGTLSSVSNWPSPRNEPSVIASFVATAYRIADAMLTERAK